MAVTKQKKSEILENLKTLIQNAESIAFTSNKGLSVDDITGIRIKLREANSTITLAKKTLIKLAFKEVHNVELPDDILPGQIAMVCSNDDAVAGLGKVNDYVKSKAGKEKMEWTWAYFEWEVKDADQAKQIASMPSRETLLGRLVGSMKSPISGLARFFDAAAEELDTKWVDTVWKLEWSKAESAEMKTEETLAEAAKDESTEAESTEATKNEVATEPNEESEAKPVVWEWETTTAEKTDEAVAQAVEENKDETK